ncbi:MAG: hypothetical protein LAP87_05640 [Acidobacteriia bacterium]|nr:hypothetical protein [Terriglobia bacterium]
MGMRSGTTFKKRQKEIARMEKQRDKFAKRLQRKVEKQNPGSLDTPLEDSGEPSGAEPPGAEPSGEVSVTAGE